jgi:hypothetical protein
MKATFPKQGSPRPESAAAEVLEIAQISPVVEGVLAATPFIDIHTHLFAPSFGKLGLWGIDELVTYHYLEAEFFRSSHTKPEEYFALSKTQQADAIWCALFVENTPVSESTRGVVAVLKAFGLSTDRSDLSEARAFFQAQSLDAHIRRVFDMAGISVVVMTNDALDPEEAPAWLNGAHDHPQFRAALRLDRILKNWAANWQVLRSGL